MATFTVTTASDVVNAGDGLLSLREAVQQANASAATADRVVFADALAGQTLTLTRGQLTVTADLTIDGDRHDDGTAVTLSGGNVSRVLGIGGSGTDATLEGLTITGGSAPTAAGGGVHLAAGNRLLLDDCTVSANTAASGCGLYAATGSALTIRSSTIRDNTMDASSYANGAGLLAVGAAVTVERSSFLDNRSNSYGGAISVQAGGTLSLRTTELAGNFGGSFYGGGGGGGLHLDASEARVETSAIVSNRGRGQGGGVLVEGSRLVLVQSTVAGNNSTERYGSGTGGGILAIGGGELVLDGCTVTGNHAGFGYGGDGGGIVAANLRIANSIVAGNQEGGLDPGYNPIRFASDVSGTIAASNGHNIFGSDVDGAIPGDLENVAPSLLFATTGGYAGGGLPASNGGPTRTVALRNALDNPALSGADRLDAGLTDQRGVARPQPEGANPDIGAFELAETAASTTPTPGNDRLTGTADADNVNGLAGADLIRGLAGNDILAGGDGSDLLQGGPGDDRLNGGTGQDTASYRDAPGTVTVNLATSTATGAAGTDRLSLIEHIEGGAAADRLSGDGLANTLGGRFGDDRLLGLHGNDRLLGQRGDDRLEAGPGSDWLDGGPGDDRLIGGTGRDTQAGGVGADRFTWTTLADSPAGAGRDRLTDFTPATDRLDLAAIDARPATPTTNDAFTFLATPGAAFTAPGQVRWYQSAGHTLVEASTDADTAPELQIELAGLKTLSAADFLL